MSRPAPHPFTADGVGDCARCPLPQANSVHVTEHQAAEQVRALLPIAAPVLGLRWWNGDWWSRGQYDDTFDPEGQGMLPGSRWDDLPLGPPQETDDEWAGRVLYKSGYGQPL